MAYLDMPLPPDINEEGKYEFCPACETSYLYISTLYKLGYEVVGCDSCCEERTLEEDEVFACPCCDADNPDFVYVVEGLTVGCSECVETEDVILTEKEPDDDYY